MMYEVETTDQAETDLREIYEYIAFELLAPDHASGTGWKHISKGLGNFLKNSGSMTKNRGMAGE